MIGNYRSSGGQSVWRRKVSWLCPLMFVIGACSTFDVSIIGRVSVAELISFAFLPYFYFINRRPWVNQNFVRCAWVILVLFGATAVADVINGTPFWFSARSLARPVFMAGFLLFFIQVLQRDPLSIVYMIYGSIISGVIKYFRPSTFEDSSALTVDNYAGVVFRVQPLIAVITVAIAVFVYPKNRILAAAAFFAGGASVIAVGGSRSSALVWFAGAVLLFTVYLMRLRSRTRRIEITPSRFFLLIFVGLGVFILVYSAYVFAAPRGYIGEQQQQKFLAQSATVFGANPLGLILSGRPQVYGAILGIMDRPILGFGSWRHDLTSIYVIEAIMTVGTDSAVINRLNQGVSAGGAGHSIIFQVWVQNGLIAAVATLAAYVILVKVFIFNIRYENRLFPYFVFMFISSTWAFLFSPPGLSYRFIVGFTMAFYVVFMDKNRAFARIEVMTH